jgi:hypothetical protein
MNLRQFNKWLEDPSTMDASALAQLEELVKEFPYSQVIGLLYLLGLRHENDYRFNRQLKVAAAYSSDRTRLRRMIRDIESPGKTLKAPGHEGSDGKVQSDRPAAVEAVAEAKAEIFPREDEKILEIDKMIRDEMQEIEEKRNRLRRLIEEKQSLLAQEQMEAAEMTEKQPSLRPLPKDQLLEDFLRQHSSDSPTAFFDPVEKARKSIEDEDAVISETLARLLASQGKIARAVKIYRKLMLNNPEKSSYFAAQIENLQNKPKE